MLSKRQKCYLNHVRGFYEGGKNISEVPDDGVGGITIEDFVDENNLDILSEFLDYPDFKGDVVKVDQEMLPRGVNVAYIFESPKRKHKKIHVCARINKFFYVLLRQRDDGNYQVKSWRINLKNSFWKNLFNDARERAH